MQNTKRKNMVQKLSMVTLSAALLCLIANESQAQSTTKGFGQSQAKSYIRSNSATRFSSQYIRSSVLNSSTTIVGTAGVNSRNFLSTSATSLSRPSKPFAGATSRPTVSPYLALSAPRASASDYYSIIRPQQQQQRQNAQQQAFAIQRTRKLNQMAARTPYSVTGDETRMGTGHAAVFQSLGSYQNTGGYFPPPSSPKKRR